MIHILLAKYWVLAHLLVTASTLCFNPSPSVGLMVWCTVSLLLMVVSLPPIFKGESYWLARQRVSTALLNDALLWMSVVALLYVSIQLLNGPRTLSYASDLKRWVFSEPRLIYFPSSITPAAGVPWFVGLMGGLLSAVAIRCALPRKQRLFALIGIALLTGSFALGGAVYVCFTGARPCFEWLGGTYTVGTLWFLMAAVALGIVGEAFLEAHRQTLIIALSAAVLNLFGLVAFSATLPLALTAILVIAWCCFALVAVQAGGHHPRFLWRCVLLLPPLFAVILGLLPMPGTEGLRPEMHLSQWGEHLETFFAQWTFRAERALDVFMSDPMLGAGPDGFEQYARFHIKGSLGWSLWKSGGTDLPCDFLRLLSSCGLIGTLLLLLPGGSMLGRCLLRWVDYSQNSRRHYSLRYIVIFFGSLIGVIGTLLMSCFGTPLHAPATLGIFLIVCACMSGWMPRRR